MNWEQALPQILFLFGIGFFVANMKVFADLYRFRLRRKRLTSRWTLRPLSVSGRWVSSGHWAGSRVPAWAWRTRSRSMETEPESEE